MKTIIRLVGLFILITIESISASNVPSIDKIIDISGVSGLTNSTKANVAKAEAEPKPFDFQTPILEAPSAEPDLSPFAKFIYELIPRDRPVHNGRWAGCTLTSFESRVGLRFIETRDIYSINLLVADGVYLQVLRCVFEEPGGCTFSVGIVGEF